MTDWIDKVGLPDVLTFAQEQLAPYDLGELDWFKLLPLPKERFHGECLFPKRKAPRSRELEHGYRIRCSVRSDELFPVFEEVVTGSEKAATPRGWRYLTTELALLDLEELAVFVAGHEAFHFLRHSKQVPGRNSEPQANLNGLRWLQEWKCR